MSIETLQADLAANIAEAKKLSALSTNDEIVRHLKEVLWPTLEAITEEISELDGCVGDMVNNAEDILQPETGAIMSAVVAGAVTVAAALKARLGPDETQLAKVVSELVKNCKHAEEILEEIVLDELPDDEDGDESDEDGDDDEADNDNDTDEGAAP